jgi:hypothetical protein
MPALTFLDIPQEEQAQMRASLRRARYGSLRVFHLVLLCAVGRNLPEITAFRLCSHASAYRLVRA